MSERYTVIPARRQARPMEVPSRPAPITCTGPVRADMQLLVRGSSVAPPVGHRLLTGVAPARRGPRTGPVALGWVGWLAGWSRGRALVLPRGGAHTSVV